MQQMQQYPKYIAPDNFKQIFPVFSFFQLRPEKKKEKYE